MFGNIQRWVATHQPTTIRYPIQRGFLVLILTGICLCCCDYAGASSVTSGEIEQELVQREREARAHEQVLQGLTDQERKLFGNLQKVEARIRKTEDEVSELENQLVRLRENEVALQQEYEQLDQARKRTGKELSNLLALLWPTHLLGFENNLQVLSSWDEADRQFHWLAKVYDLVQERIDRLRIQGRDLALGQVRLEKAKAEIEELFPRLNARKDELLHQKLDFLRRVQEVRAQKVSTEEQVGEILRSITELNYQLQVLAAKTFTDLRGRIPWPVQGRVVERFRPQAEPPHRGLSLEVPENAPVRAISWGKVVHSDVLRGYGHVVIVYHGQDYYSLYAFLNKALVAVGQEVEKDEEIGAAGFYPKIDGPGLYFELRFHQNPVNPDNWLVAK